MILSNVKLRSPITRRWSSALTIKSNLKPTYSRHFKPETSNNLNCWRVAFKPSFHSTRMFFFSISFCCFFFTSGASCFYLNENIDHFDGQKFDGQTFEPCLYSLCPLYSMNYRQQLRIKGGTWEGNIGQIHCAFISTNWFHHMSCEVVGSSYLARGWILKHGVGYTGCITTTRWTTGRQELCIMAVQ